MKKLFTFCLAGVMTLGMSAQKNTTYEPNRFWDNWSVGLNGGSVTTLHTGYAYWKNMRPIVGLQINKEITPVLGMSFEGNFAINSTPSKTAFDNSNVAVLGRVNLMNLFGGFKGERRFFDIEALGGVGWLHYYNSGASAWPGYDSDAWSFKTGLNLNFNLGEKKAWTVQVKPAVVWNLNGIGYESNRGVRHPGQLSRNSASMELAAGIVYHFKNSNGTHYFKSARLYDQAEVDALNAQVNDLRGQVSDKNNQIDNLRDKNNKLRKELEDARNQKPQVTTAETAFETTVSFRQGKSTVDAMQMANIERMANYMKENPNVKVIIKGYASPEGGAAWNKTLSKRRADAVKKVLVKKFKVDGDRIQTEGCGVGSIFSDPTWNRVSICTAQ